MEGATPLFYLKGVKAMTKNEQRKIKYDALRKAGFSSKEANKLKSAGLDKISQAIKENKFSVKWIEVIAKKAYGIKDKQVLKELKQKSNFRKFIEYKPPEKYKTKDGTEKIRDYLLRYNYRVGYKTKRGEVVTNQVMTIASDKKLSKNEIRKKFNEYRSSGGGGGGGVSSDESMYEDDYVIGSFDYLEAIDKYF